MKFAASYAALALALACGGPEPEGQSVDESPVSIGGDGAPVDPAPPTCEPFEEGPVMSLEAEIALFEALATQSGGEFQSVTIIPDVLRKIDCEVRFTLCKPKPLQCLLDPAERYRRTYWCCMDTYMPCMFPGVTGNFKWTFCAAKATGLVYW